MGYGRGRFLTIIILMLQNDIKGNYNIKLQD